MQACFLNDASSQSKSDKISHLFPSTLSIFIFPLFSFILILCLWSYNLLPIFVNMYFEENVDAWLRYIIYTVAFIRLSSEFNRNQYIKKIFFLCSCAHMYYNRFKIKFKKNRVVILLKTQIMIAYHRLRKVNTCLANILEKCFRSIRW